MKINNLKINAFGKLKNKNIELANGINIIFGSNEAGKSSVQKFIMGMLYGISKNKNGKEISDFDKFKPWITDEFSGKLEYTLDNKDNFEIYREFKKKNPIIYNSQKEDISKKFNMDKTKGIDFFTEQTGIDEETFYNTAITEQEGIKLSKSSQNTIVQKISNLVSSGDDNISFKKSLDKIVRNQNEDVGSTRTSQRPINLVQNKINRLIEEKSDLESYKDKVIDNSERKEELLVQQKIEETKKEFIKKVKNNLDNNKVKIAEINFNRKLEKEYNSKIRELNSKISDRKIQENIKENNYKNYYIVLAIFLLIFIILMFVNPHKVINFAFLIPAVFVIYLKNKNEKESKLNIKDDERIKEKIINEIEILNENREIQKTEAQIKEEKLYKEIEEEKTKLINEYIDLLDITYIKKYLEKTYDEVLRELEAKENRINTIRFELKTIEITENDISNKLENLAKIEEELQDAETEMDELLSLNNSYNIAKECLEKAYDKVKENISPRFTQNLSDIISKISNNRYSNIVLNDEDGLTVEIENGNYIPVSRLSVGTIDQMYLSLRLSAINEIATETMPIILDEVFAYFDDQRLENILKYLDTNFRENQIILFTCSKREKEILEKLNIKYNFIQI